VKVNRSAKSFDDGKATKGNLEGRFLEWLEKPEAPAKKVTRILLPY
jgi:hypothetical protein